MKKTIIAFMGLALACVMLSACGVKPSSVDSPDASSTHPRTYPDVRTDPMPSGGPATTTVH